MRFLSIIFLISAITIDGSDVRPRSSTVIRVEGGLILARYHTMRDGLSYDTVVTKQLSSGTFTVKHYKSTSEADERLIPALPSAGNRAIVDFLKSGIKAEAKRIQAADRVSMRRAGLMVRKKGS